MRKTSIRIFSTCLILLHFLSCATEAPERAPDSPPRVELSETQQMVAELAGIARQRNDPRKNPYLNASRAQVFQQLLQQTQDPQQRIILALKTTQELLYAGHTRQAIAICEPILAQLEQGTFNMPDEIKLRLYRLVGICYMRLGEQENCLQNHTNESCLWPIKEKGQHLDQEGSRKAVQLYSKTLELFPEDLVSRWLLNVAYQTLGEHPQNVPSKWLIPNPVNTDMGISTFSDVAIGSGLDISGLSGGACMEDFNGDGFLDIMASSWNIGDQLKLLLNDGKGEFTDYTEAAGLEGITGGLNLIHADFDNDGDRDVLVLRGAWLSLGQPNSLLQNDGKGNFTDVTRSSGIYSLHSTQTGAWADFDNDGLLDLFIGNESGASTHPCELFRNNGDGTFSDLAQEKRINAIGYFKGCSWGDIDNDGDQDLFLSNLKGDNHLYQNQGKAAGFRFENIAAELGVTKPENAFPTWFWDVNNDGWLDLFVGSFPLNAYGTFSADVASYYLQQRADYVGEHGKYYQGDTYGGFADVTERAGLAQPLFAMGSNYGDINNDGIADMYLGTGEPDLQSIIPNRMLIGSHGGTQFQDVTVAGGFGHLQKGHGVAFGDIDNDGDQDVYTTLGGAYEGDTFNNALFLNPGNTNSWVQLKLVGTTSNRDAIGARVEVVYMVNGERKKVFRTVGTGGSFGANSLRMEIGLALADSIELVRVSWPGSEYDQEFKQLPLNSLLLLREGSETFEQLDLRTITLERHDSHQHAH